jgi:hypothetical protein
MDDLWGSLGKGLWGLGKATLGKVIPGGDMIMDKLYDTIPFRNIFNKVTGLNTRDDEPQQPGGQPFS